MKRLFISAVLFLLLTGADSFVLAHIPMKGTWVLKNVEAQNLKTVSILMAEKTSGELEKKNLSEKLKTEVPEELHYTCPVKIAFDEEKTSCTLHYGNEVEKTARYYQAPGETSIYFSIKGTGSIPEKQFFLKWKQEDNISMQLKYSTQGENALEEEYVYYYQLQK